MRANVLVNQRAIGHLLGARSTASPLREEAEMALAQGKEVEFNFAGLSATQSFIDELVGVLILRYGPDILERLIFKACSEDVRAMIEFVAADRCDQYLKTHSH